MDEQSIFLGALERDDPAERLAFVATACDGNERLQERIAKLLEVYDRAGSFLEVPAAPAIDRTAPVVNTLGDFRILREIGRGGMGVVYEAEQVSLRRRVALKVLPFAALLDRRQSQRFQNEAQAAAALNHPNIVSILLVGCERGVHYYAMEFIEGRTLAQVIEELREKQAPGSGQQAGGKRTEPTVSLSTSPQPAPADESPEPGAPKPETSAPAPDTKREPQAAVSTEPNRTAEFFRSVAQLGIQAAEALEHAHQMEVVHRDIKPSNLMVDASGHLWITDFGLAMTQKDPTITMTGDIVGTLRYMSPEQALGDRRRMDYRSDIYSLGVTFYELLTLRPAFAGDSRETLVRRLLEQDPPPPRNVNRAIPRDLETIVLKATAKEPQQRYTTAQEMADDLKHFLANEPILARRPSLADRAAKWARRHRPVVWSSAVAAAIAAVIGGALFWGSYRRAVRLEIDVGEHLSAAQAFLQSRDYVAAERQLADARGHLETADRRAGRLDEEVLDLSEELAAKHQAIERFDQFQKLRQRLHSEMYAVDRPILDQAQEHCRTALGLFGVRESAGWKAEAVFQNLDAERQAALEEGAVELLFIWARLEIGKTDGQPPAERVASHRRAIEALENIESFHPGVRAVQLWIADSREAAGDAKGAAESRSRAGSPRTPSVVDSYLLGEHHVHHGRPEEALKSYWQALSHRPDHFLSLLASGVVLGELKRHEAAEAMLSGVIALNPQSILAYVKRGASRLGQGKILLAQADFRQATKLDPELTRALIRRARQHIFSGSLSDYDKGIADFSEVIRLDPTFALAYAYRGACYAWKGEADKAITDCNQALRLDPELAEAHESRAIAYQAQGILDKALEDANQAVRLNPQSAGVYCSRGSIYEDKGELDKALADYNESIRLAPGVPSWGMACRGRLYVRKREFAKAAADLDGMGQIGASGWFFYKRRAVAHFELKHYDKALESIAKAVELRPGDFSNLTWLGPAEVAKCPDDRLRAGLLELATKTIRWVETSEEASVAGKFYGFETAAGAYGARGRLHGAFGQPEKAIADCEKSVALLEMRVAESTNNPRQLAALNSECSNLGEVLRDASRPVDAEKAYRRAIVISEKLTSAFPKEEYYWYQYVDSCWRLMTLLRSTGRMEEAENFLRGMKDPLTAGAFSRRANRFRELGKADRALADFAKAIELEPKSPWVWRGRAAFYAERGQWEKAIADFDKALELQPSNAGHCNKLAWYLATCVEPRVRKPDRAVKLATKATQLAPNDGTNWNTLGVAQYRTGDHKAAIESLTKSIELRSGGDAFDWFFLAMAHSQLKNKDEARKWYDKAAAWMEKNKPDDEELLRFRAEAAELLGLPVKPPAAKEKTEAKPKAESGKPK